MSLSIPRLFIGLNCALIAGCPVTSTPAPIEDVAFDASIDVSPLYLQLVESGLWDVVALQDDPFEPPGDATCDAAQGIRENSLAEEPTLEIETTFCGWGTVQQPLLSTIKKGEPVNYRVWHFELTGDTPATVAIRIGDWDLLAIEVPQPQDGQLLAETVAAPAEFLEGTPVFFTCIIMVRTNIL